MNIMDKTPAKITLHIDGMTWEQVREMIEERYGALMWDHKSTAYPTDSVVVRMAFAEPSGNVAQRAIGKAAPQQEAQEPVMIYHGDCTIDCGEHGHHHVELLRMIPAGSKLYTAPQPSPASQGDAARWRMLPAFIEQYQIDYVELLRDIDAARAAQEGKSHDN